MSYKTFLILLSALFALFILRSINLLALPLYLDEGIYLFWARLFQQSSSFAYVSMQDGKTPLFFWFISFLQPYVGDLLLAGRLISVFFGTITALSWFIIGKLTLDKKTNLWLMILFFVTPYFYLVERMAFVDSTLTGLASLSLLFLVVTKKRLESKQFPWDIIFWQILSGLFLSLAFFTKTSAKIFLYAEVLVAISWILEYISKKNLRNIFALIFSLLIIISIYHELIGYMRVGSYRFWDMITVKETLLSFTPKEIVNQLITKPTFYIQSLTTTLSYITYYLGGLTLLIFLGGLVIFRKYRQNIWVLLYCLLIWTGTFFSAKMLPSRYYYLAIPSSVFIASYGAISLWQSKNKLANILLILIITVSSFLSLLMITNPLKALYAPQDQSLFVSEEFSALGLYDIINYLKINPQKNIVGVSGTWGAKEGTRVMLEQNNIENLDSSNIVERDSKVTKEGCPPKQIQQENYCIRWNGDNISNSKKENKYFLLLGKYYDLTLFKKFHDFQIIKEYSRPYSGYKVYLIKLN